MNLVLNTCILQVKKWRLMKSNGFPRVKKASPWYGQASNLVVVERKSCVPSLYPAALGFSVQILYDSTFSWVWPHAWSVLGCLVLSDE